MIWSVSSEEEKLSWKKFKSGSWLLSFIFSLTINWLRDVLSVTFRAIFIYDFSEQSWSLNYKKIYFHPPWSLAKKSFEFLPYLLPVLHGFMAKVFINENVPTLYFCSGFLELPFSVCKVRSYNDCSWLGLLFFVSFISLFHLFFVLCAHSICTLTSPSFSLNILCSSSSHCSQLSFGPSAIPLILKLFILDLFSR